MNGLLGTALVARGLQLPALWLNVAALTANVVLNVALVPPYGVLAAAWAAVACEVGLLAGTAFLVRRRLGFLPSAGGLARALPAAGAMAAVLWPLRDAPAALSVPVGAAVYLGAAVATRALDPRRLRG